MHPPFVFADGQVLSRSVQSNGYPGIFGEATHSFARQVSLDFHTCTVHENQEVVQNHSRCPL